MPTDELAAELVEIGRAAGLAAVGFADAAVFESERSVLLERRAAGLDAGMQFTYRNPQRSTDPSMTLPSARSLVVGALSYARADPGGAASGSARVARYAWRDHYADLRAGLGAIADRLADAGRRGVVLADDNALVDRAAAVRAGIGWYGKNANVLLPGRGSWFVLGAVLTDAELAPSRRLGDGCGPCRRCMDGACPTDAIVAPGVVDARRCLAWTVQDTGVIPAWQRVALGDRIYGCDDCQEVCPPSRVELGRAPEAEADAVSTTDVVAMLAADDETLLASYGRWYIPRREPRYLRRNALVVLGNVGDPTDPSVITVLRAALGSPDEIIVAHAVWAARRLGLGHLVSELVPAPDADGPVASEMSADVAVRPDLAVGPP
ncbi:MAG: tRNA epoxyqueuosine(34) reductase QueG [Acidimicrobiales bacterium]